MGNTMSIIQFYCVNWKIKEIISASNIKLFDITNLNQIADRPSKLFKVDNGTYYLEFTDNNEFIEFK